MRNRVAALENHTPTVHFNRAFRADGSIEGVANTRDFKVLTSSDIGNAIGSRRNKRSSGLDKIPDIVLKRTGVVV